jgi:hypothetical protein
LMDYRKTLLGLSILNTFDLERVTNPLKTHKPP